MYHFCLDVFTYQTFLNNCFVHIDTEYQVTVQNFNIIIWTFIVSIVICEILLCFYYNNSVIFCEIIKLICMCWSFITFYLEPRHECSMFSFGLMNIMLCHILIFFLFVLVQKFTTILAWITWPSLHIMALGSKLVLPIVDLFYIDLYTEFLYKSYLPELHHLELSYLCIKITIVL